MDSSMLDVWLGWLEDQANGQTRDFLEPADREYRDALDEVTDFLLDRWELVIE